MRNGVAGSFACPEFQKVLFEMQFCVRVETFRYIVYNYYFGR